MVKLEIILISRKRAGSGCFLFDFAKMCIFRLASSLFRENVYFFVASSLISRKRVFLAYAPSSDPADLCVIANFATKYARIFPRAPGRLLVRGPGDRGCKGLLKLWVGEANSDESSHVSA
jgi:hypothetical protein